MEPRLLLALCGLTYRNPPENVTLRLARGKEVPIRDMCRELLRLSDTGELPCGELRHWEWETFSRLMHTEIDIIRYINRNDSSGFVGMAFRDKRGQIVAAMRGSETSMGCAPNDIDWVDNFAAPFSVSVQYQDAEDFANAFPTDNLTLTGHSKGANNALYALSVAMNESARAVVFNGQGFACDFFHAEQRRTLRQRGVNYVVADDLVGALLCHPENRIFVRGKPGVNPHAPEAFEFHDNGNPIPAMRTLRSRAIDLASRAALPLLRRWAHAAR